MVSQNWKQMSNNLSKRLFHLLTITLLSILLPLSFLLLSRLVSSQYLQALVPLSTPRPASFLASLVFSANPILLFTLIFYVTIATFLHCLLGKSIVIRKSSGPISQLHLSIAWVVLCVLQICVGLGIEEATTLVIDTSSFGMQRSLWCRLLFFLGLHTTMLHWSQVVVKPVVDDTIFGVVLEKNWVERVAMAVSFGGLWWLRLRNEVESLVIVTESKMQLLMEPSLADFVGWGLYYLTVAIGFIKISKSIALFSEFLLCKRKRKEEWKSSQLGQSEGIEEV